MKKILHEQFEESYLEGRLENGLKVVLWHKPQFTTSAAIFATPYGALDFLQQDKEGKVLEFPSGIAHFLEHKLFESDKGDVMDEFSKLGANVNAFTSYNETAYYFTSSDADIRPCLNLLLDFVQDLNISEESVEKEKGIINQELMMYQQMPDNRLIFETFKSLYHNHPLKMDIGGNQDSVNSTTKELLEECYRVNYHPSKMTLVCVTPMEPELLLEEIKKNQQHKTFSNAEEVSRAPFDEPVHTVSKDRTITMDVTSPKVSLTFKLKPKKETAAARTIREWSLRCVLEANFTSMNPEYQTWLDEKKISDYFGYEVDISKDYEMIMFYNDNCDKEEFKKLIESQLAKIKESAITYNTLKQLKRRYYGQSVRTFNNTEDIALNYLRNEFAGVNFFDVLKIIDNLDLEEVKKVMQDLDFKESCIVEIRNK